MAHIYWKHELLTRLVSNPGVNISEDIKYFSVPSGLANNGNTAYICIVHENKVWAARAVRSKGIKTDSVECADVSDEQFAKEILLKHLLMGL